MPGNETPLNSNTTFVLGATQGRLLQLTGLFHSGSFISSMMDDQLEQIRYDLETTAKMFAEQQGLAPGAPGWATYAYGEPIINTGTLYNGIKAVRQGQRIHLRSEARDKWGHYYGGHVEFGHQNVPARPHLRPALYAVSQASQGKLRSALHNLLTGAFTGNMQMAFGTGGGLSASYYNSEKGSVAKYMTKGTRKQQMKYHFGSTTRGRGGSRKLSKFRQSFSSTAKRSMGWRQQKSLNQVQRLRYRKVHYSPLHSSGIRSNRKTTFRRASKRAAIKSKRSSFRKTSNQRRQAKKQARQKRITNRNIRSQTRQQTFMAEQRFKGAKSYQNYNQRIQEQGASKNIERTAQNNFMKTQAGKEWGARVTGYHGNSYFNSYQIKKGPAKQSWTSPGLSKLKRGF